MQARNEWGGYEMEYNREKEKNKTNTENTLDIEFMNAPLASEMKYRLREMNFI